MTDLTAYVSTPRVSVGGSLNAAVGGDLVWMEVEEDIAGMCTLEARLLTQGPADPPANYRYLDRTALDFGTTLSVRMGPQGADPVFDGRVTAIGADYPGDSYATVTVKAEDALQELRLARRTRTFEDSTLADIAQTIAGDHGLTAQVDVDGPQRRVSSQVNLSDLAFLRSAAQADGAEVWLSGTTLHLQGRADRDAGETSLRYGGGDLLSFAVTADLAHQCTDVTVTGWSVSDKDAIAETGGEDSIRDELGDGTSGTAIIEAAFSERHERLVVAEPLASDDARSRAAAAYLDRARRFVTGTGTAAGRPEIRVGARVTLQGLGNLFNGTYRVVRTCHRFELVHGYETEFDVERVGLGAVS